MSVELGGRVLGGSDLRRLCQIANRQPVSIFGGRVDDKFDLSEVSFRYSLRFEGTTFDDTVDLTGASVKSLQIIRCRLNQGLTANNLVVTDDLDLSESHIQGAISDEASVSRRAAVWISDARIGGRFRASGTFVSGRVGDQDPSNPPTRAIHGDRLTVGGNVRLIEGFTAEGEVRLISASVKGSIDLTSCRLSDRQRALDLGEAQIEGSLFVVPGRIGDPPHIEGRVDMGNAYVKGHTLFKSVNLQSATEHPNHAYYSTRAGDHPLALWAPGAYFGGGVHFVEASSIHGPVFLANAQIDVELNLADTLLVHPEGVAIDLGGARINGDLTLKNVDGAVRLAAATISGSLQMRSAEVGQISATSAGSSGEQPDPLRTAGNADRNFVAIEGHHLKVHGNLDLAESTILGGVDLRLAEIDGAVSAGGARALNSAGIAIRLSGASIGGTLWMASGFHARGTVRLNRARIGGSLDLRESTFRSRALPSNQGSSALEAINATVSATAFLCWKHSDSSDFTRFRTAVLDDDPSAWGKDGTYSTSGMSYEQIASPTASRLDDIEARLRWLNGRRESDVSSFEQLSAYYRSQGRVDDAERVLIERNRAQVHSRTGGGIRERLRNAWATIQDVVAGYGYRPFRVSFALMMLLIAVSASLLLPRAADVMRASDNNARVYTPLGPLDSSEEETSDRRSEDDGPASPSGSDVCGNGAVRCFSPVLYAVDTVVPLIELHQRSTWYPDRATRLGNYYHWGLNISVLLGWVASSALVLSLTRSFGSERR